MNGSLILNLLKVRILFTEIVEEAGLERNKNSVLLLGNLRGWLGGYRDEFV